MSGLRGQCGFDGASHCDIEQVYHLAAAVGVALIARSPMETIERNIYPTELLFSKLRQRVQRGERVMCFLPVPVRCMAKTQAELDRGRRLGFRRRGALAGPTARRRPLTSSWPWRAGGSTTYRLSSAVSSMSWVRDRRGPTAWFCLVCRRRVGGPTAGRSRRWPSGAVFRPRTGRGFRSDPTDGHQLRSGRVFNIGSDRPVSILELAQRVLAAAGSRSRIEFQTYGKHTTRISRMFAAASLTFRGCERQLAISRVTISRRSFGGRHMETSGIDATSRSSLPHLIRLRGPWDYEPLARTVLHPNGSIEAEEGLVPPPGRCSVPRLVAMLGADFRGRVRYRRRFGRPTGLRTRDRVELVMERVDALGRVTLNQTRLGEIAAGQTNARFDVTVCLLPVTSSASTSTCPGSRPAAAPCSPGRECLAGGLVGEVAWRSLRGGRANPSVIGAVAKPTLSPCSSCPRKDSE